VKGTGVSADQEAAALQQGRRLTQARLPGHRDCAGHRARNELRSLLIAWTTQHQDLGSMPGDQLAAYGRKSFDGPPLALHRGAWVEADEQGTLVNSPLGKPGVCSLAMLRRDAQFHGARSRDIDRLTG
jgi:hypothetical protein